MRKLYYSILFIVISYSAVAQSFRYDSTSQRYSLLDKGGKEQLRQKFIEVKQFVNGKAWVKDTTGIYHSNEIVNADFDYISPSEHACWGLIDKKGKWLVKPKYQRLDSFYNNTAVAKVFDYTYVWQKADIESWVDVDSFAGIESKSGYRRVRNRRVKVNQGMIDINGKEIIPFIYYGLGLFIDRLVLADMGEVAEARKVAAINRDVLPANEVKDVRFVLLDAQGKIVKKLKYDNVELQYYRTESQQLPQWRNEYYTYTYDAIPKLYQVSKKNQNTGEFRYGLIDSKGVELVPCKYNRINTIIGINAEGSDTAMEVIEEPFFYYFKNQGQFVFVFEADTLHGSIIANMLGDVLFKPSNGVYIMGVNYRDSIFTFGKATGKNDLVMFEYPVSSSYDSVRSFFKTFDAVQNTSVSVLECDNMENPEFPRVNAPFYLIRKDYKYGVWTSDLKEIIPTEYYIRDFSNEVGIETPVGFIIPPQCYIVNSTGHFIFTSSIATTQIPEVIILDQSGIILLKVSNCTSISWDISTKKYILKMLDGTVQYADQNAKLLL